MQKGKFKLSKRVHPIFYFSYEQIISKGKLLQLEEFFKRSTNFFEINNTILFSNKD